MKAPASLVVIGLGYVGLPLALAFSREFPTAGFDIDASRIEELLAGVDRNNEFTDSELISSDLFFTKDSSCISDAEFIVVTVPTPVTQDHVPDLSKLQIASQLIGTRLRERSSNLTAPIIVFESTTYPGCTEEFCGPLIEQASGLESGVDFFLGYSPERTNFGDDTHTVETVIKVVSGQTSEVAESVRETYARIAKGGTHIAVNIKTAEASKVIENIQRDLNIALFNELAMIFDRMDIRSADVFDAAATKWNFHRYQPGLVGGHCIPVDPYYLTYASSKLGYDAHVVLAGRDVNERVAEFTANKVSTLIRAANANVTNVSVLLLGVTFKPNVSDLRNSKTITLAELLLERNFALEIYDPVAGNRFSEDIGFRLVEDPFISNKTYDVVILAVPHDIFMVQKTCIVDLVNPGGLVVDLVSALNQSDIESLDRRYWSL
ncbi:MAG: nucleotide sugar dehydrogenase [Chloroflexota bacterium]|nr:nucleotide sugar dehydrogenase [Chloroflexota bacterium]